MDRELLIEIGVEELPAAWMPGLTRQLAERLDARLKEFRIAPGAPIESFSTPRRLTARVARHRRAAGGPRRDDHRSAGVGRVRQATASRRRRRSASRGSRAWPSSSSTRAKTPKGEYLAFQKHAARQERRRHAAGRACAASCAISPFPSRCTGTRRSRTAGASCCSAGRSAGCCSSTAAASCRSRSAARRAPPGRRCRTSSPAR